MDSTSPIAKKRGRPSKKDKLAKELEAIVDNGTTVVTLTEEPIKTGFPSLEGGGTIEPQSKVVEVMKEVIVIKEIIKEVPPKVLEGFALWKALKDAQYPQGGGGNYWEAPDSFEKAYVARPEELYTHFLSDPEGWDLLRDTLARAWLQYSLK